MPGHEVNLLLDALPSESRDWLIARSVRTKFPLKMPLYRPQERPRYAFFLVSGIASMVAAMKDGGSAEVGIIGAEGFVGSLQLLGPACAPSTCFMQVQGAGYRIPLSDVSRALDEFREVRLRVMEFMQQQTLTLGQIAGCNRLHEAEERLSRWLLMTQDRLQCEVLPLTHEFLGQMLGSRRTTVTSVVGALQRSGLIENMRGQIRILDRRSLESAACGCYQIARNLHKNLYKNPIKN